MFFKYSIIWEILYEDDFREYNDYAKYVYSSKCIITNTRKYEIITNEELEPYLDKMLKLNLETTGKIINWVRKLFS